MGLFDILVGVKDALVEKGYEKEEELENDFSKKIKNASDSQLKRMYDKTNQRGKRLIQKEMDRRGI